MEMIKMSITFHSLDEKGYDVYVCKVCRRWVKKKDFHKSIRSCKDCIKPYLNKENI